MFSPGIWSPEVALEVPHGTSIDQSSLSGFYRLMDAGENISNEFHRQPTNDLPVTYQ